MQNAKGEFIDVLGNVIPAGEKRYLRPMTEKTAAAEGCPDRIFNVDADFFVAKFGAFSGKLQR